MTKNSSEKLILSAEDFRAKMSLLQEKGLDWLEPELDSSLMHSPLQRMSKQKQSSWRMSPDFYQVTKDAISESSSLVWPTQGIATSNGAFLTRNSSEFPNDAAESSLSQILQESVSPKYSLSVKAAEGIIRRAERRGKTLPEGLKKALLSVVHKAS